VLLHHTGTFSVASLPSKVFTGCCPTALLRDDVHATQLSVSKHGRTYPFLILHQTPDTRSILPPVSDTWLQCLTL